MSERTRPPDGSTRDWQPSRFDDGQFTRVVPTRKWGYFADRVRPLADEPAAALRAALFAGVGRPFHFARSAGWMGKVYRRVLSKASDIRGDHTMFEAIDTTLGWSADTDAYLVYPTDGVYVAACADLLDSFNRGWLPLDTLVIGSEATDRVALFWEGCGPYFARRGDRSLTGRSP